MGSTLAHVLNIFFPIHGNVCFDIVKYSTSSTYLLKYVDF